MYTINIKTGPICEYCKRQHDGSYGSGRFCSKKCSKSYYHENKKYTHISSTFDDGNHINKKELGLIGESGILHRFMRKGIDTYIPYGDNTRADLIAEFGDKLQKIQIKTSSVSTDDIAIFKTSQNTYSIVNGEVKSKLKRYSSDEIDYFALYDYNADRSFLIPVDEIKNNASIILRYTEPKNNQKSKIRYADDYEFDKVIDEVYFEHQNIIDAESFEVIK